MKTLKITGAAFCMFLAAMLTASCSSDDNDENVNPGPTGETVLVAIDTAKINVMRIDGTSETTIINRMENLNSYFTDLSFSPDGTKIAYTNFQATGVVPNMTYTRELRVADIDGSNDHAVYTVYESGVSFGAVKFGNDNKIFFKTQTVFPSASTTLHLVNADGTGHEVVPGTFNMTDVSASRQYYIVPSMSSANVTIIDKNGDGGFGGTYHNENFGGIDQYAIGNGVFTSDDKYAVIPYKDGNDIKVRIINMATKAAETKTIAQAASANWVNYHLSMGVDKGVLTLRGADYAKSKSYVFNLTTGEVAQPFENNDDTVSNVYIRQ